MPGNEHSGILAMLLAAAAVSGYLLGSLPFGYLVARSKGVDIFAVGSKSPGATNVGRVLGKGPRNLVFILDVLKGTAAAGWPLLALSGALHPSAHLMGYVGLAGALAGHSFSCFTKFRGGKGVSTAAGGLVVLLPAVTAIAAGVWTAAFFISRLVSLASILAALSLPVSAWLLPDLEWLDVAVAALIALFVVLRHRTNIQRLLNGSEKRFDGGKKAMPAEGGS